MGHRCSCTPPPTACTSVSNIAAPFITPSAAPRVHTLVTRSHPAGAAHCLQSPRSTLHRGHRRRQHLYATPNPRRSQPLAPTPTPTPTNTTATHNSAPPLHPHTSTMDPVTAQRPHYPPPTRVHQASRARRIPCPQESTPLKDARLGGRSRQGRSARAPLHLYCPGEKMAQSPAAIVVSGGHALCMTSSGRGRWSG